MTVSNPEHELNADSPIDVTELGIVMLCNAEHDRNAWVPIDVSELGNVMLCNAEHDWNAESPIDVTAAMISVETNWVHPLKASDGISFTPDTIMTCVVSSLYVSAKSAELYTVSVPVDESNASSVCVNNKTTKNVRNFWLWFDLMQLL